MNRSSTTPALTHISQILQGTKHTLGQYRSPLPAHPNLLPFDKPFHHLTLLSTILHSNHFISLTHSLTSSPLWTQTQPTFLNRLTFNRPYTAYTMNYILFEAEFPICAHQISMVQDSVEKNTSQYAHQYRHGKGKLPHSNTSVHHKSAPKKKQTEKVALPEANNSATQRVWKDVSTEIKKTDCSMAFVNFCLKALHMKSRMFSDTGVMEDTSTNAAEFSNSTQFPKWSCD